MLRFAAYARVSTDEQSSTATQLARIAEHAVFLGGAIVATETDVMSGMNDHREGYGRIVALARRREIDGVIVWKLDRFGRNHVEGIRAANELETLGVRVHSVTEPTDDPFVRDLMLLLANREIRVLSERVKVMQRARVQEGNWQWPPPPGYKIQHRTPDDKRNRRPQLVPDDQAPLIKRLFEIAATGRYSVRALRDEAQKFDIRSGSGGILSRTHVHKLLTNPAYVGDIVHGRRRHGKFSANTGQQPESEWTVFRDAHEAIIDRETYAAVQAAFKQHQRFQAGVRGTNWLLTGLVYCAHCGSRMYGTRAGRGAHSYTCTRGAQYGDCALKTASGPRIENYVRDALRSLTNFTDEHRQVAESLLAARRKTWRSEADAQRRNLTNRRNEIEQTRTKRARQMLGEAGSLIAPDLYQRLESEDVNALRIIERELLGLVEPPEINISEHVALLQHVKWDELDTDAWREFALLFIERVQVMRLGERKFVKGKRGSEAQLEISVMWTDAAGVILGAVLQGVS